MKLLTHNMLSSKFLKGVKEGYPLILRATLVEKTDFTDFEASEALVKKMLPKIDYKTLLIASKAAGVDLKCEEEVPSDWELNSDFIKKFHFLLTGIEVMEGELECPETHRIFSIREGIPNMLVNAEEEIRREQSLQNNLEFSCNIDDKNRVRLENSQHADGYINASRINFPGTAGKYIAAQAPLITTIDDFWTMVYENNIQLILMLCKCIEAGMPKCEKYWSDDEKLNNLTEKYHAFKFAEESHNDFCYRRIRVRSKKQPDRVVHQLHFTEWPDHGCPNGEKNVIEFINLFDRLRAQAPNNTILLHCSAGCGRTGSLIAVDIFREFLSIKKPLKIDIKELVIELRRQRICMVQTLGQYIFLHKMIAHYAREWLSENGPSIVTNILIPDINCETSLSTNSNANENKRIQNHSAARVGNVAPHRPKVDYYAEQLNVLTSLASQNSESSNSTIGTSPSSYPKSPLFPVSAYTLLSTNSSPSSSSLISYSLSSISSTATSPNDQHNQQEKEKGRETSPVATKRGFGSPNYLNNIFKKSQTTDLSKKSYQTKDFNGDTLNNGALDAQSNNNIKTPPSFSSQSSSPKKSVSSTENFSGLVASGTAPLLQIASCPLLKQFVHPNGEWSSRCTSPIPTENGTFDQMKKESIPRSPGHPIKSPPPSAQTPTFVLAPHKRPLPQQPNSQGKVPPPVPPKSPTKPSNVYFQEPFSPAQTSHFGSQPISPSKSPAPPKSPPKPPPKPAHSPQLIAQTVQSGVANDLWEMDR